MFIATAKNTHVAIATTDGYSVTSSLHSLLASSARSFI